MEPRTRRPVGMGLQCPVCVERLKGYFWRWETGDHDEKNILEGGSFRSLLVTKIPFSPA